MKAVGQNECGGAPVHESEAGEVSRSLANGNGILELWIAFAEPGGIEDQERADTGGLGPCAGIGGAEIEEEPERTERGDDDGGDAEEPAVPLR